jgi:hypothetical protein
MNKLLFDDMMGWFTLAIFFQVYHDYQTQCRTRKGIQISISEKDGEIK